LIFHLTSKKPVLLVGNGARSADAADLIHEFANKTKIPVLTTMNAVDLVQDDDKLGFIGTYGNRVANSIIAECDLLISVGARLGLRQIGHLPDKFAPNAMLIRADVDQYELSRNIKPDEIKYLNDAKEFMLKLLSEDIPQYTEWRNKCFDLKKTLTGFDKEIGNFVIEKISSLLPEDPIVAVDVGQNQCWTAQSLTLKGKKGRILIGGGYGSMGCGLPFAIGASIAKKYDKVFCITGDGGLQMNIQELETVVRENIPVKIFVLNNYALGKISEVQANSYHGRFAQTTKCSGYSVPDFEKIAIAYGIKATTLATYELLGQYYSWLNDDDPCLINIKLPCDTLLIPKIEWNTMEILPKLDTELAQNIKKIIE
jgi:thiamine pyrophosphate-dependent acetolactate synthase large subunit-like protein